MGKKITIGTFKQSDAVFFLDCAITACGFDGDTVFVGTENGLLRLTDGAFASFDGIDGKINALFTDKSEAMWCAAGQSVYRIENGAVVFSQSFVSEVRGFAEDEKRLWILTADELFRFENEETVRHCRVEMGNGMYITAYGDGGVFVFNGEALLGLHGKRPRWGGVVPELSDMPTNEVTALAGDRWGHLFVGTKQGLALYDGKSAWYTNKTIKDLPDECVTALAIAPNGDRYIGTDGGIILQRGVRRSHYTEGRWLPSNMVTAIAVHPTKDEIWVGTDKGASCISFTEMTLLQKAEHFQAIAEKYHTREDYFSYRLLSEYGNMDSGAVEISDNDGLWTGSFCAAMALKYAVTKDEHALEIA